MTSQTLSSLAGRVEEATGDQQRGMLWDAFCALRPATPGANDESDPVQERFLDLIELGAFLDAAMTLVPEGRDGVRMDCRLEDFHVSRERQLRIARLSAPFSGERSEGRSYTSLALALTAACLRSRAAMEMNDGE
jgi:hypothetical protein